MVHIFVNKCVVYDVNVPCYPANCCCILCQHNIYRYIYTHLSFSLFSARDSSATDSFRTNSSSFLAVSLIIGKDIPTSVVFSKYGLSFSYITNSPNSRHLSITDCFRGAR